MAERRFRSLVSRTMLREMIAVTYADHLAERDDYGAEREEKSTVLNEKSTDWQNRSCPIVVLLEVDDSCQKGSYTPRLHKNRRTGF